MESFNVISPWVILQFKIGLTLSIPFKFESLSFIIFSIMIYMIIFPPSPLPSSASSQIRLFDPNQKLILYYSILLVLIFCHFVLFPIVHLLPSALNFISIEANQLLLLLLMMMMLHKLDEILITTIENCDDSLSSDLSLVT